MRHIVIVTPAAAQANTGNWHTAARWARVLRQRFRVTVCQRWEAAAGAVPEAMIALHARRSADSIAAYAQRCPGRPLIVVLTGTDLYGDLAHDVLSQRSMRLATRLVVLNELGARSVPKAYRDKVDVVLQSAPALKPAPRLKRRFRVVIAGHLRDEKDPALVMRCAQQVSDARIEFIHLGRALQAQWEVKARATEKRCSNYRWLDGVSRAAARQHLRRAHLLLHPSKLEGGAQAIVDALRSGTPVIASDAEGNAGLLGLDYPGLFPVGDASACVRLLERAAQDPKFYRLLTQFCKTCAAHFDPRREARALLQLVQRELRKIS